MADVSKLKKLKGRRDELGEPPTLEEASMNLTAPEVAPAPEPVAPSFNAPMHLPPVTLTRRIDPRKVDGRSIRRTNRTVQFATRVTPEWDERIRALAQRDGVMLVEILERALDAYEQKSSS